MQEQEQHKKGHFDTHSPLETNRSFSMIIKVEGNPGSYAEPSVNSVSWINVLSASVTLC